MVCFDTGPIIWGVQGRAKPGQEHMVRRTKRYIRYLADQRKAIMIPAPALAEYLIKFDQKDREQQKKLIEQQFFVPAFDLPAAELAAELEHDSALLKSVKAANGVTRDQLRVDAQIVAIAVVQKAEKIITNDPHLKEIARGRIPVEEVPQITDQPSLFPEGGLGAAPEPCEGS